MLDSKRYVEIIGEEGSHYEKAEVPELDELEHMQIGREIYNFTGPGNRQGDWSQQRVNRSYAIQVPRAENEGYNLIHLTCIQTMNLSTRVSDVDKGSGVTFDPIIWNERYLEFMAPKGQEGSIDDIVKHIGEHGTILSPVPKEKIRSS